MVEISSVDPNGLMYLGDLKDPKPPFYEGYYEYIYLKEV